MPYKNVERRREWDRQRKRRERAKKALERAASAPTSDPDSDQGAARRITLDTVIDLLRQAAALAQGDTQAKDVEKARTLTAIARTAVEVIEAGDLVRRIEALETALAQSGRLRLVR